MTKAELVEDVARAAELTKKDAERLVEIVFESIIETLNQGEKIELRGFGSFRVRERGARRGRNPKTGDPVSIPAKQVVRLPDSIKPEYGALLDSLGNSVHAVSKAQVSGKTVHVVGCGPLGLFAIVVAKALGALKVYASDVAPFRLDLARRPAK